MRIVITSAVIVNILAVLTLLVGLFYSFKQPKNKAVYGYFVAGSIITYIFALCIITLYGLIASHNLYCFILPLCIISPFIIGRFVKYETLKGYTVAQIMCFVVSLIILLRTF